MRFIGGLLLILAGIALGLYVGGWLCFIGGIIQFIHGITPEIIAENIAFGIVRVFFASLVGWISALALIIPGAKLMFSD